MGISNDALEMLEIRGFVGDYIVTLSDRLARNAKGSRGSGQIVESNCRRSNRAADSDNSGHKVLIDRDLATLYGVPTKRLNEQVRRNRERFPNDFMFQLNGQEVESLRSQIATSKAGRGGRRYAPYAFTEHGAIMAATILNSPRAVEVSVFVVRAFVRLRQWMAGHQELAAKLNELDKKVAGHDDAIRQLVTAIRKLMSPLPDDRSKRRIGF